MLGPSNRGRKPMSVDTLAKTEALDMEDVEYLRHGDTPLYIRIIRPAGAGPVPGDGRVARRRLDRERPHPQQDAPRGHGEGRHRDRGARLPPGRGRLSGFDAGHQLCDPLAEGERRARQDASRARRHHRHVERRPSCDARGDAPARSEIRLDPAAGGLAERGRERARRRAVLAGDQSARAASQCASG